MHDKIDIEAQVRETPPTCVRQFQLVPAELPEPFDDNVTTVWGLACKCGGGLGRLLGHRLAGLNPTYQGDLLVSPLAFDCTTCGHVTELFDTDIHGYHAEIGKIDGGVGSAKIRGSGTRTHYACPVCSKTEFSMIVGFVYWDLDLTEDDPDLPVHELFNVFLLNCTCSSCGRVAAPTDFGKL